MTTTIVWPIEPWQLYGNNAIPKKETKKINVIWEWNERFLSKHG